MKITEPIFITRTPKRGYEITGRLGGRTIRRYGLSEEEAKKRFFDACAVPTAAAVVRRRAESTFPVAGAR